jgi:hypothetical protein
MDTVSGMWMLRRIFDCRSARTDQVLRHVESGRVFTDGSEPVVFPDSDTALSFGRRFLDGHEAWQPVYAGVVSTAA